jgi:maleate isomerase
MEATQWKPDGWGATTRVGVLTPHADLGPEAEFQAMAPPTVTIHAARVPFGAMAAGGAMDPTIALAPVRAFAEPPGVDDAVELLASAPLGSIAFGFTSSAYVIGQEGEAAMLARLGERANGIPVVATGAAMVEALRALEAERVAVVSPPWFDEELTDLGRRYFEAAGFGVAHSASCDLPSDQAAITPSSLHAWVMEHMPDDAEAVAIGGNGFRAVGAIDALERDLGRPVVTANQALFWAALRAAEMDASAISDYGRLFGRP